MEIYGCRIIASTNAPDFPTSDFPIAAAIARRRTAAASPGLVEKIARLE
ncbi:hypothetical protein [Planctomyces sp. SH-PL62]|nr:hypothetical protein [Planctomyces sp. SH-PL62]